MRTDSTPRFTNYGHCPVVDLDAAAAMAMFAQQANNNDFGNNPGNTGPGGAGHAGVHDLGGGPIIGAGGRGGGVGGPGPNPY